MVNQEVEENDSTKRLTFGRHVRLYCAWGHNQMEELLFYLVTLFFQNAVYLTSASQYVRCWVNKNDQDIIHTFKKSMELRQKNKQWRTRLLIKNEDKFSFT